MDTMELNSFLLKFSQLWIGGQDAHLEFHSHAGNAWVGLRLNLGPYTGPPPRSNVSNSRSRRRDRRAAARKENDNSNVVKEDDVISSPVAEEASDSTDLEEENLHTNEDLQNVQSITEEVMGNTDAVNHDEGVSSNEKPDSTSSEDVCIIDNTENKVCDDATVGEELAFTNDVAVEKPVASQRQSEVVEILPSSATPKLQL